MDKFDLYIETVLKHEGGFVNHPSDPGGATNHGITAATLARYRGVKSVPVKAVKELTLDEAKEIYRADYYAPHSIEDMPTGIGLLIFDSLTNISAGRVIRWAQTIAGARADGIVGPITLRALKAVDPYKFITEFTAQRNHFYATRPHFPQFGLGWFRRSSEVSYTATLLSQDVPNAE